MCELIAPIAQLNREQLIELQTESKLVWKPNRCFLAKLNTFVRETSYFLIEGLVFSPSGWSPGENEVGRAMIIDLWPLGQNSIP